VALSLRVLSEKQLQDIHAATLRILETTGVMVDAPDVVELLHEHGADVRADRVRIPARLVEQALATAPRSVRLYDRSGEGYLELGSGETYFGAWLDNEYLYDSSSRQHRPALLADLVEMVKVCDQLEHVDWMGWAGSVSDVPPEVRNKVIFRTVVSHTLKPIVTTAVDVGDLLAQIELAAIVAGGYEQLRARPFLANASEPISPLHLSKEGVDKLQICAARGIPFAYYPMTEAGVSAPSTSVGPLVMGNVEVLAGLVVHQLLVPGAPFIYGNIPGMMDMKTLAVSYGAPELFLGLAGLSDLGHWYGLPVYGTAGCGDSMEVDAQLGAENALSVMLALLTGADLVHDVGVFGAGMVGAIEANVFADELIGMTKRITQGLEVNAETLAVEAIDEVGPGGDFMSHESTLDNFRSFWYPTVFTRIPAQSWVRGSERLDLTTRLRNRVVDLLDTYEDHPLASEVESGLDECQRRWSGGEPPN